MTTSIIPSSSPLRQQLEPAVRDKKLIIFSGLPGVGKSLMVQQAALLAQENGRRVHLLQWDIARMAFEIPEVLARFPEIDGVTHAGIRLAAGQWLRHALADWLAKYSAPEDVLLGECPLIGSRFIEVAQRHDDKLEAVLAGPQASFLVPAPTREVRKAIEMARSREMADPLHEREAANALPNVLDLLMVELRSVAKNMGVQAAGEGSNYDPEVYMSVYRHLLQHRPFAPLWIDELLPVKQSAQVIENKASELIPSAEEVRTCFARYEAMDDEEIESMVSEWWKV